MIINYVDIIILRFKDLRFFQACFSAKEQDCLKIYAFDIFESIFLLCPKTHFPMIAVLLLLLLASGLVFGMSAACIAAEIAPLNQCCTKWHAAALSKQSGILRTHYIPTCANTGIRIQGENNHVYIDRDHGVYEHIAIYDVGQQIGADRSLQTIQGKTSEQNKPHFA